MMGRRPGNGPQVVPNFFAFGFILFACFETGPHVPQVSLKPTV